MKTRVKVKTTMELSEEEIGAALKEWAEQVQGWEVDRVRVEPATTTLGYGMAEYQGATVSATIEGRPRPPGDPQR
jgi:hypothetical protein